MSQNDTNRSRNLDLPKLGTQFTSKSFPATIWIIDGVDSWSKYLRLRNGKFTWESRIEDLAAEFTEIQEYKT